MKIHFNLVFALTLLFYSFAPRDKVKWIEIRKTELYATAPYRINCSDFENQFSYITDTIAIRDPKEIALFLNLLKEANNCTADYNVDTRGKIFLYYYSGKIDSICIENGYTIQYNEKMKKMKNLKLVRMIWGDIPRFNDSSLLR